MTGNGSPLNMPLSALNAPIPIPTNFPDVRNLINRGTGGQPFVQHTINDARSNPTRTTGGQAAYLGRVAFTASGILNVYMTGDYQFYGSIGARPQPYDFDRDTAGAGNRRSLAGRISTGIGSRVPGTPYDINITGRRQVDVEGNSRGITSVNCR